MFEESSHLIIAYYHLIEIKDPHFEVLKLKSLFKNRDITSRIYISEQGINCQMSALRQDGLDYIQWLQSQPGFENVLLKIDPYHEHVFPRLTIKYRRQLVAFDAEVDLSKRGEHVAPADWKEMLEKDDGHILLDIRNDYEWRVGRFSGAEQPPCQTSRGFKDYAKQLKEKIDSKTTPVMMYCTGGIRCELFSAMLKKEGFEKVYQLDGGVINYGQKQGNDHWLGKLFVFDDRLAVPINDETSPVIGLCHHCHVANEAYYNCANTDCNELFLCCSECLRKYVGCCSEPCTHAKRVRPYQDGAPHKPFKKMKK